MNCKSSCFIKRNSLALLLHLHQHRVKPLIKQDHHIVLELDTTRFWQQDRAEEARRGHNPKIVGSNPSPVIAISGQYIVISGQYMVQLSATASVTITLRFYQRLYHNNSLIDSVSRGTTFLNVACGSKPTISVQGRRQRAYAATNRSLKFTKICLLRTSQFFYAFRLVAGQQSPKLLAVVRFHQGVYV